MYNGGGVGIIDVNNDGLKDIFLGGNMTSSKLLLNKGSLIFEDITETANLSTSAWVNGISIIDINNDGRSDIYLSVGGPNCETSNCYNKFFINQSSTKQILFEEKSASLGLQIDGYSQQGLFADFDNDGDLDLFQLQNFVDHKTKNYPKPKNYFSPKSIDKFFINQESETGELNFIEKSEEWNVTIPGFGLGVALTDVNNDDYLDVYVANDFITDDIFYVNDQGKRFEDKSKEYLKHTSYNSMGVDIADINSDQREDIVVVDMLPVLNSRQKTMLGEMNFDKYKLSLKENYNSQFIRNTLQIHNGNNINQEVIPFSEVGANLDIHETDWSWSPLILDYNNDTKADLFITNGYGKNITDLDFINYNSNSGGFGSKENAIDNIKEQIQKLPSVDLENILFLNVKDGKPTPIIAPKKAISNGAAYADLDNDGDLELVLNNLNQASEVIINTSNKPSFQVELIGDTLNRDAIGAKLTLHLDNGMKLVQRLSPVRSYMSSMAKSLLFGIGEKSPILLEIEWPNGKYSQVKPSENSNKILVDYKQISKNQTPPKNQKKAALFSQELIFDFDLNNMASLEYDIQPLLHKPCLVPKPLLRKHNQDVFVSNIDDAILKINSNLDTTSIVELNGYVVTDFKFNDQKNSIEKTLFYVATKQNRTGIAESKFFIYDVQTAQITKEWNLEPGIYRFDFINLDDQTDQEIVLVHYPTSKDYPIFKGSSISFYDINGKALSPQMPPLENKCITSVQIEDINGDSFDDIIVNGEWMSPKVLIRKANEDEFQIKGNFDDYKGLWQETMVEDIDGDGDKDILLLNIGTNCRYSASKSDPIKIIADDLDKNGSIDPLLINFNQSENNSYTYHSRDDIAKILPAIKNNFNSYQSFGKADAKEILQGLKKEVNFKSAYTLETIILEQKDNFQFEIVKLPIESQYSIINGAKFMDIDDDQDLDIVLLTNNEDIETHNGKLDALNTLVLLNNDSLNFEPVPFNTSGIQINEPTYEMIQTNENSFLISSSKGIYKINSN